MALAINRVTSTNQRKSGTYEAQQHAWISIMEKVLNVLVGIALSTIAAHVLSLYIAWVPEVDIWFLLLIIGLNLTQCLPNPSSQG
jgi:hypothetical protein